MSDSEHPAKIVPCPNCRKPAPWSQDNRWRPFCSERCKLIDLGEWFEERHRIPAQDTPGEDQQ